MSDRDFVMSKTGVVVGGQKWSETHVGGGGGGIVIGGIGLGSSRTHSRVENKQEVWLRYDSGREECYVTSNDNVKMREGHIVTAVMANGNCVAMYNHDTRMKYKFQHISVSLQPAASFAKLAFPMSMLSIFFLCITQMSIFIYPVFGLGWLPFYYIRKSKLNKRVNEYIEKAKDTKFSHPA